MTSLAKRLSVPVAAASPARRSRRLQTRPSCTPPTSMPRRTPTRGGSLARMVGSRRSTTATNPLLVSNTATNGFVSLITSGQDVNRPYTPAAISDSIYISADITLSAAQATGDYFFHLSDGGASNFNARTCLPSPPPAAS